MKKTREELLKEIERIQTLKGAKLWRAAHDFALQANPKLAREQKKLLREVDALREEQDDDYARSAGGHFRFGLHMSKAMIDAIRKFDPTFLTADKHKNKNPKDSNKLVKEVMKTFPEYKIPRKG